MYTLMKQPIGSMVLRKLNSDLRALSSTRMASISNKIYHETYICFVEYLCILSQSLVALRMLTIVRMQKMTFSMKTAIIGPVQNMFFAVESINRTVNCSARSIPSASCASLLQLMISSAVNIKIGIPQAQMHLAKNMRFCKKRKTYHVLLFNRLNVDFMCLIRGSELEIRID